jgi:beta-lactamase class D
MPLMPAFSRGCALLLATFFVASGVIAQSPPLARHFEGFDGAFVVRDQTTGRAVRHNLRGLGQRDSPCSTFKIVNALIGLETGLLTHEGHRFEWDGVDRGWEGWNRSHTLETAFRDSAVWYFQRLSAQIGPARSKTFLEDIGYGNRDPSGGQNRYWLGSSLTISPNEQLRIVERLLANDLPFSPRNQAIVRKIMLVERGPGWSLHGKTGTMTQGGKETLGWFVGWVERGGRRHAFACRIRGPEGASGRTARKISEEILRNLTILP